MIVRKPDELAALKVANRATTKMLRELKRMARPGIKTIELDAYARDYIARLGGEPIFERQAGFPGAINTNRNDVVVHGIPGEEMLEDGDILTIDGGMRLNGFVGDAAITFAIGTETDRHRHLIDVTRKAMNAAIDAARVGNHVGDVSWAMQSYAEAHGCNVARGFCGHGLGRLMWEEHPQVPFAGNPGDGEELVEGLVMTVEPVVIEGDYAHYMANEWEARTVDGSWVAQFERAVMVTPRGGLVLSGD